MPISEAYSLRSERLLDERERLGLPVCSEASSRLISLETLAALHSSRRLNMEIDFIWGDVHISPYVYRGFDGDWRTDFSVNIEIGGRTRNMHLRFAFSDGDEFRFKMKKMYSILRLLRRHPAFFAQICQAFFGHTTERSIGMMDWVSVLDIQSMAMSIFRVIKEKGRIHEPTWTWGRL